MPSFCRTIRGLLLLSALLLCLAPVQADNGGTKVELQVAYDQLYSAVMRKEFRAALGLLAPDYSLAKLDGTPLKRAQLEENWKSIRFSRASFKSPIPEFASPCSL